VVNVSANYFSTLFKQATGRNFADYVARVRIEKTKNLLLNPNLRISEIAFEVGSQSLSQSIDPSGGLPAFHPRNTGTQTL
jgi:YesN/AraC family two-component response regulator